VHGECEDIVVAGEADGRAVALVHVEVHHQRPADEPGGLEVPDGDGQVVVDAEALARVGSGVVVAAADIDGEAVLQRQPPGQDRPPRYAAEGAQDARVHQRRRGRLDHRRFEVPGDRRRVGEAFEEPRRVDPQDLLARDGLRHEDVGRPNQPVRLELQVDLRVLANVEAVEAFDAAHVNLVVLGVDHRDAVVHGPALPGLLDRSERLRRDAPQARVRAGRSQRPDQRSPHHPAAVFLLFRHPRGLLRRRRGASVPAAGVRYKHLSVRAWRGLPGRGRRGYTEAGRTP